MAASRPDRFVAAVVQASPAFLDRDRTIDKTLALLREAASLGAALVVFPEAFVSGYPYWLWDAGPNVEREAFISLWESGIDIPGSETETLGAAVREAGVVLVIGANERESAYGRGTLYNTMLTFDRDGAIVRRHRKLMPTYRERTVWGMGDGSGLAAGETALGPLGGLISWENYMPLARFHQYAQGAQIYVAVTADESPKWTTLMQAVAAEGRTYVASANQVFRRSAFPDHPYLTGFGDDVDVLNRGGSLIADPGGELLAGPLWDEEGILTAEIDSKRLIEERHSLDVTGHYARPDVFQLRVIDSPSPPFE